MAISHARAKIIALVEAATPTSKARIAGGFKHADDAEVDRACARSRDFFLTVSGGAADMQSTASFQRRTVTMGLHVDYVDDVASAALDTRIVDDADAIIAALSTGAWAPSTSTIVAISADPGGLMPYTITTIADGAARRLSITLTVTYDTRVP